MSDPDGSATSVRFAHPQWFAFKVRPRHEKVVALQLAEKEQHCFLPLVRQNRYWAKRLTTVDLPLIPGYVFCRTHALAVRPIIETRGVIDVIRDGFAPAPVAADEVEAIVQAIDRGVPIETRAYFNTEQRTRILTGPLAGLRGPMVQIRDGRWLVLSISLLQCSVQAEVGRDEITCEDEQYNLHSVDERGLHAS